MLSSSDIDIVEKVLGMDPDAMELFFAKLDPGAKGYLDNILQQYDNALFVQRSKHKKQRNQGVS
jgi:hypothetical protein